MSMSFGESAVALSAFTAELDELLSELAAVHESMGARLATLDGHLQGMGHPRLTEAHGQLSAGLTELENSLNAVAGSRETVGEVLAQFGGA